MTLEMEKRVLNAMWRTWEYIGSDVLQIEGVGDSISRAEVIELVLDAGRVKEFGGDKEAYDELSKLDYKAQIKLAKKRFTFKRYS